LAGRATEERPRWRYFDRVAERADHAQRLLDIDAGTGTMLAALPQLPPLTVATDAHEPSIQSAAHRFARGVQLVQTQRDRQALPFADAAFDLVISRHPIETWWTEIARVLAPGGHYFSQQVGPHSRVVVWTVPDFSCQSLPAPAPRAPRAHPGQRFVRDDFEQVPHRRPTAGVSPCLR
jgi:SAM-dependent methyltransferase